MSRLPTSHLVGPSSRPGAPGHGEVRPHIAHPGHQLGLGDLLGVPRRCRLWMFYTAQVLKQSTPFLSKSGWQFPICTTGARRVHRRDSIGPEPPRTPDVGHREPLRYVRAPYTSPKLVSGPRAHNRGPTHTFPERVITIFVARPSIGTNGGGLMLKA